MDYYTPLHEFGTRPKQYLVAMHIHGAAPTLIWERGSDWKPTAEGAV